MQRRLCAILCGMNTDEIDMQNAIVGIPLEEYIVIEQAVIDAKKKAEEAVLAANAQKKQAAIEETLRILNELFK